MTTKPDPEEEEEETEPSEEEETTEEQEQTDKAPAVTPETLGEAVKNEVKKALGVGSKEKGKVQGSDASEVHQPPTSEAPAPSSSPPEGMVEGAVRKILAEKEHNQEHERLSKATDKPPRAPRKGIAAFVFGK